MNNALLKASPDPFLKDRLPITTVDEISNQLYGAWGEIGACVLSASPLLQHTLADVKFPY